MPARPAGDGKRPHFCGLSLATRMRCPATPGGASALARLEARVALADHEDLATATHDLAVAVTGLRRFQGGQDLHDIPLRSEEHTSEIQSLMRITNAAFCLKK